MGDYRDASGLSEVQANSPTAVPRELGLRARAPRWRWGRWSAVAVVAVVVLVSAAFATRFGADPTLVDSPLIGQPVPDVSLPFLERDGELSLRDLSGQVLVINFWASWCVACKEEHDDLTLAARRFRDRGVRFVGIVYQDRPESAIAWLDEMGRGYDNLLDPGSRAAIDFGVFGVPETFFVDRDGNVVGKVTGASSFQLLATTLEQVLDGEVPGARRVPGWDRLELVPVEETTVGTTER